MDKIVTFELSEDEHRDFVKACKKSGVVRPAFVKNAVLDKINQINSEFQVRGTDGSWTEKNTN